VGPLPKFNKERDILRRAVEYHDCVTRSGEAGHTFRPLNPQMATRADTHLPRSDSGSSVKPYSTSSYSARAPALDYIGSPDR
jgi:hypothetical protein